MNPIQRHFENTVTVTKITQFRGCSLNYVTSFWLKFDSPPPPSNANRTILLDHFLTTLTQDNERAPPLFAFRSLRMICLHVEEKALLVQQVIVVFQVMDMIVSY